MPIRRRAVALDVLRGAVAQKVEATSVRVVAEAIGMSTTGVYMFMQHGTPQNRNYQKLIAWYVQEEHGKQQIPDVHLITASLEILTRHLSHQRRRKMQQKILNLLAEDEPVPQWAKQRRKDSSGE